MGRIKILAAAQRLGISRTAFEKLIKTHKIKTYTDPISGWRVVDEKSLERLSGRRPGRPKRRQSNEQ